MPNTIFISGSYKNTINYGWVFFSIIIIVFGVLIVLKIMSFKSAIPQWLILVILGAIFLFLYILHVSYYQTYVDNLERFPLQVDKTKVVRFPLGKGLFNFLNGVNPGRLEKDFVRNENGDKVFEVIDKRLPNGDIIQETVPAEAMKMVRGRPGFFYGNYWKPNPALRMTTQNQADDFEDVVSDNGDKEYEENLLGLNREVLQETHSGSSGGRKHRRKQSRSKNRRKRTKTR
jgi:hypothetical protein